MSSKAEQLAACEGKARMSREKSKVTAKRQRKKGQRVEAYKCQHCGFWHVGTNLKAEHAQTWTPRPEKEKDRPTPERKAMGEWTWVTTQKAGGKAAKDMASHPIDRLEWAGVISNEQASAGRDFENLTRSATQSPGVRDSCTLWEPKGFESDDGNVSAVNRHRELCRMLGMLRDRRLRWVCVEQNHPKPQEIGQLREDLNECARFFK